MKRRDLIDRQPVLAAFQKRTRDALRRMGIDWHAVLRRAVGKTGEPRG
jgi:hypothetical protein